MKLGFRGGRPRAAAFAACAAVAIGALTVLAAGMPAVAATTSALTPNLTSGSAYLVDRANLIDGHYYESVPGYADFGLTIDGAFALAATGDDGTALRNVVSFIDNEGKDPSGRTVNDWTGIGTSSASGGSIGKEALLAEVVGDNPRNFGGHNLIAALDASVCTKPSTGTNTSCPGTGSYLNDASVFDQTLGIMAQLRAGQVREAAAPIAYLESLQSANGSFPSLIPASGGPDVDSTAMAAMALALAPGSRAARDVTSGVSWIASKQERNGGFPSSGVESINSTGLAIQALTLRASAYGTRIEAALAFLAREQNSNGGFDADAGQHGSNLRASTQAVGGAVGTSFGTLHRTLTSPARSDSHSGGAAGSHQGGAGVGADPGRLSATPGTSSKAATTAPSQTSGVSPGTSGGHQGHPAAQTRYPGVLASNTSRALPAVLIWPAVGLAVVALALGLVLSWWRRKRARSRPEPPAAGSPAAGSPPAEALQSRVRDGALL
jgi:hypothetical protein